MVKKVEEKEEKPKKTKTALGTLVQEINKQYGKMVIQPSDKDEMNKRSVYQNYIPSESIEFGRMMHVGGLAKGRVYMASGPSGIGKTTTTLALAKPALPLGYMLVYVDFEQRLVLELLQDMGIDTTSDDKFLLLQPEYCEDAFDSLLKLLRLGKPLFIIIDSISTMNFKVPAKQTDYSKTKPGQRAFEIGKFLRKSAYLITQTQSVLILVSQLRTHGIGGYITYKGPTGGEAPNYAATCKWMVTKGDPIQDEKGSIIGMNVKWKLTKNILGLPLEPSYVAIKYGKGFYLEYEAVELGIKYKVINESGSWCQYKDFKIQGRMNLVRELENNPKMLKDVRNEILEKIGGHCDF